MLAGTPPHVWRIIAMEGMERFSYYGFRAILTLYFVNKLGFSEHGAAAGFAFTSALAYAAPLVGAWLSDERWGRYSTIMRFSSVYSIGLWVLVAAAAAASLPWTIVALVLVGLSTGGIKPCVSTFGADQIDNAVGDASDATRRYFAVFYASINVGSVFSYLLIPAVRAVFGYAAAFAVPAVLLAVALAVFIGGRRKYTMVPPRDGGVGVPAAIWRACAGKNDDDAKELRSIGEVMVLLPVFWLLYDQQGSIWVIQASEMRNFGGRIQPETMGVINPILILVLLPLFETRIYPALERRDVSTRAPWRMMAGMVVAAAAFVVAGFVDLRVNSGQRVNILWQLPQLFLITVAEILVSVTGLEYSYTRAPEVMRASVSALYLLTTAVGNLLGGFLFVAAGHLGVSRPAVLFLCAILVLLTAVAFRFVARKHFDGFEAKPVPDADPAEELQAVENVLLGEGGHWTAE